ncbi:hypothetical protein [endosymbiont GvMRE of Glomus versiforme]|uniref:hypothetical protein n=1 Tax=endosymbiont GvMRE of Glomus versiforme TaxID=2039283 RepID=UPI000EDB9F07|nr:hypothetical protein [endosymbiont GvMRE of Glomus versiforme]RHZ37373.1 hypothetical protein GvMRE_I1g438 [endosymbiont GvMRE of Glomus versiforme]RHZ37637.1 hypothetical protein GvMRE_I1g8 [endosymbiont GvMRE of Glomus versiforme]
MNENNQINPLKNSEDYEKLKNDYEAEILKQKGKAEQWKNTAIKSDEASLAKDKIIERLEVERDDWKKEARRNCLIELNQKETKNKNEFLEHFQRLQTAKIQGGLK